MIPSKLGDRIKKRRKALKMTQQELAVAVRVRASRISDWENGRHAPRPGATRRALANALALPPSAFKDL